MSLVSISNKDFSSVEDCLFGKSCLNLIFNFKYKIMFKAIIMYLTVAPDIIFNPVDIREGEALTLTCEANGRHETYTFGSFTQYWGHTQVDNQVGTTTGSQYTWTTQIATYLDTGVYECSVDNTVTDRQNVLVQRKRVNVDVRASPIFTTDTQQRTAAEIGSTVILSKAFFNSYLNFSSVTWTNVKLKSVVNRTSTVTKSNVSLKKNGKVVKLTGYTASVVINNFKDKDTGVYTVTVCNSVGCSSSDINLLTAGPPLVPLELTVINSTQRSISLRWRPNFPGGDYTQMFILHYRLQGSGGSQTVEYEDNPGGYVYADVTGLQPGSVYELKIQARNTRENGNEGQFTDVVVGTTESFHVNTSMTFSLGTGLGIGLGICLLAIIGLVVLVLYYRRRKIISQNKGTTHQSDNRSQVGDDPSDNRGYISDSPDNQDRSEYSHLEEHEPEKYAQLKMYENINGTPNDVMRHGSLHGEQPATYETVPLQTYENAVDNPKDSTYLNTSRT